MRRDCIGCADDRQQGAVRIVLPTLARIYRARHEHRGNARGRSGYDEFNTGTGRDHDAVAPLSRMPGTAGAVDRHAVDRHDAEPLGSEFRPALVERRQIQIGDRGGVEHPPQLPLAGLQLHGGERIVRVRHRHIVDGQVFRGLARPRPRVGRITVPVHQGLPRCLTRRRRSIWMQQLLISHDEHAFR